MSIFRLAIAVLAFSLAACGSDSGDNAQPYPSHIPPPAGLSYLTSSAYYVVGTAITALTPTVNGGPVSTYSVSPALPAGLTLNASSGQISGTPTTVSAQTTYTVTASSSSGSTSVALTLVVYSESTPLVTVSYGTRQVILNWNAVQGATYYRVFKNPDGVSGYSQMGGNLTTTSLTDTVSVHLSDWIKMSYRVAACNSSGCTDSPAINSFVNARAIGHFKASNPDSNDYFGTAVALSADGTTLAVAANQEASSATGINSNQGDNSAQNAGAVYVFVQSGGVWAQQAYLKASNTEASDYFGEALAISADGNTLVVGANSEDSNATGVNGSQSDNSIANAGAVYVFTRSGAAWSQQAYVKASNTDANDMFGDAIAVSADGNTLAVGAMWEDSGATGINGNQGDNATNAAGAVYVFTRSGSAWSQQAYIKASSPGAGDSFGGALALSADGNTLAVGAGGEDSGATGINGNQADNSASASGAVYVYTRSGSIWSQQAYVKASNTEELDSFGAAVALSANGNVLAVGATGESSNARGINGDQTNNSNPDAGAVYVFGRTGSAWSQQAYVKASNTDPTYILRILNAGPRFAGEHFGAAVAISADGTTLAIGAPDEDGDSMGVNGSQDEDTKRSVGAVYVFSQTTGSWSQKAYVKPTVTSYALEFGNATSLSFDGRMLAVGAHNEYSDATGVNGATTSSVKFGSGAVYLY